MRDYIQDRKDTAALAREHKALLQLLQKSYRNAVLSDGMYVYEVRIQYREHNVRLIVKGITRVEKLYISFTVAANLAAACHSFLKRVATDKRLWKGDKWAKIPVGIIKPNQYNTTAPRRIRREPRRDADGHVIPGRSTGWPSEFRRVDDE